MKIESNKNWTTCLRLNTGDGSPRVFLLNSHFLGSVPNQLPCGSISHWLLFRTTTMINPQVFPFVTRKAPQTRWYCVWSRGHIYRMATIYKPSFLERGADGKQKTELRSSVFSQIQVVLVLG